MEWISVEDRLPEYDSYVDIWDSGERITDIEFVRDGIFDIWQDVTGAEYESVTHWMPLPEPPEE